MKRYVFSLLVILFISFSGAAQQIMYSNLKSLIEERGDTVTTLRVEKRTKYLMNLMGGADYRISVDENNSMSRYLKSRCYAVRVDSSLYINCRKMRYKRFRFGNWYAPALQVAGHLFFMAQPLGQVASENTIPSPTTKLAGELGSAIQVSGIIDARVYYEVNLETGRAEFVSCERMLELLAEQPALKAAFEKEADESAEVIGKYLKQLK